MNEDQKTAAQVPPEVEELLKDLRRYIAESKDDWEKRRELLDRINAVLPGGEMEMFIAAVREMGRMGTNYANMVQTFNQLFATQQVGNQFAELLSRGFGTPNPFLGASMAPNAFDYWRQLSDFMTAQTRSFTSPDNK
ncbi:MAG TPA: hypothetical protein VFP70_12940 [Burkholderiales bacterium]|jgi:hypothetical protein|nr:hypothetical protein [Burkholderiales bacterium]